MIDEKYLQKAIYIRKTYLNLNSNLDTYKKKIEQVSVNLNDMLKKVENLEKEVNEKYKNKKNSLEPYNKFLDILNEIEEEGKKLEKSIEPINKDIEKLAKEENELYRQIVEHHNNLTEDQIVEEVKNRLLEEGLL